jgi:hypothetical protein
MSDKLYSPTIADLIFPSTNTSTRCMSTAWKVIRHSSLFQRNCGSMDTIRYFPSCCIVADRKAVAPTWVSGKAL